MRLVSLRRMVIPSRFYSRQAGCDLDRMMRTLRRHTSVLLAADPESYVLIGLEEGIVGFFPTFAEARSRGYELFKAGDFMFMNVGKLFQPLKRQSVSSWLRTFFRDIWTGDVVFAFGR